MASDWRVASLAELTEIADAARRPVRESDRRPGPYPYYGASGVIDYVDGFTHEGQHLLVAEDGENLRTRRTPIVFIANGRFWVNNHAHALRARSHADASFLLHVLMNTDISQYLTGSTQPKLTQAALLRVKIRVPPSGVRASIGSLLGALDDKIELNRLTSATIEKLARALFASWFGTLDPDRTPEGWTVAPLGDHVEVVRGLSYTGAGLAEQGVPLHNLDSIYEGGGYKYAGIKHYRREYKERHVVREGDVIIANTEQGFEHLLIAYPAIVPQRFGEMSLFSHHLYRVRPLAGSPTTSRFLYLALMSPRLRQVIVGYSNGTTVNMLPADALQRPRLALPPAGTIRPFDDLVAPLFAKQEQLQLERETLARLRDLLLPKLMSGDIRLRPEGEAVAEAAAPV